MIVPRETVGGWRIHLVSLPIGSLSLRPSPLKLGTHSDFRRKAPTRMSRGHTTHHKGHSVANIKSQIKRIKTNQKATERNRAVKSEVKTSVRQAREAIKAGDKDKAQAAVKLATKKLDKAVSKGVLHKNQAANRKSAIAKQAASL